MSRPAVEASGLSKRYRLGRAAPYGRFSEALMGLVRRPVATVRRRIGRGGNDGTLWALRDVSFTIERGAVVGILGRNGAGKSTLLKILSRITEPTLGEARLRGRVGSLLEVGTGFHPELTGRENIFLNGAILGMRRREIDERFDAIVDFAEIERFLETPVKHYSSGMYMRLAFAVAAHLEAEILLVDEVLAVGDAQFQRKCLGKMSAVASEGRTVCFVSHSMSALQQLCEWCLVLDDGRVVFSGPTVRAVEHYLRQGGGPGGGNADLSAHRGRPPGKRAVLRSVTIANAAGEPIRCGDDVRVRLTYDTGGDRFDYAALAVSTLSGQRVITCGTHLSAGFSDTMQGRGTIECVIPDCRLAPGEYTVMVAIGTATPRINVDQVDDAVRFEVELGNYFGTGVGLLPGQGSVVQRSTWRAAAGSVSAPDPACGE